MKVDPRQLPLTPDMRRPDWHLTERERKVGLAHIRTIRQLFNLETRRCK